MQISSLSFLLIVSLCGVFVEGLVLFNQNPLRTRHPHHSRITICLRRQPILKNNKEDEIARLEEQLRRLKEEADAEERMSKETTFVATTSPDDYVGRGPAKRPVQPMEEMLSETWKQGPRESSVTASQEGNGFPIPAILGAVALVVFLGFFSQVPVGQEDLSKYQAIKASTQIDLGDINPVRAGDF
jgi:hypothetical protein